MRITIKTLSSHLDTSKRLHEKADSDSSPIRKRLRSDASPSPSDEIIKQYRVVNKMVDHCAKNGNWIDKKICALPFTQTSRLQDGTGIIQRFAFGKKVSARCKERKTILLVGTCDSGKSCLINNMINYIFGVDWRDPFRFQLVQDNKTECITIYDIHHADGFRIPFSLTIVDTPEFSGDPSKDEAIIQLTRKLLQWDCGVQELDMVGLVVRSNYSFVQTFDSMLSIFGKDFKDSVNLFLTFAGSQEPPVLNSVTEAGLPLPVDEETGKPIHFKFNYSKRNIDASSSSWRRNDNNFQKCFANLATKKAISLTVTMRMIEKKKQLESMVEHLQTLVRSGYEMKSEMKKLEQQKVKKLQLPAGLYVTNCDRCGVTCSLYRSVLLDPVSCSFCPDKCSWEVHTIKATCWMEQIPPEVTEENNNCEAQNRLKTLRKDYEENRKAVLKNRLKVYINFEKFEKIALRPFSMTSQSIDTMISIERMEQWPGFQAKIKSLENLRH